MINLIDIRVADSWVLKGIIQRSAMWTELCFQVLESVFKETYSVSQKRNMSLFKKLWF